MRLDQGQNRQAATFFIAWGILLYLCPLAGCGGPPGSTKTTGSVDITITYGGEAVIGAEVHLMQLGKGEASSGTLDEAGKVKLSNVVVGDYSVMVQPPQLSTPDNPVPEQEYPNIPEKFRDYATSPLKAEVNEGANDFKFDLKESEQGEDKE